MANKTGAFGFKESNEYTPQTAGMATIKVGETFALVTFEDGSKEFDNGTNKKKIKLEDMPKFPKLASGTEKRYRVRLNKEGDMIDSLFPAEGHFVAKVIDAGRRKEKDSEPEPYEKVFGLGTPKESRHLEFYVTYKVTKQAMKGATAPYFLHYKFDDNGQGFATFTGNPDNPKATRLLQLVDWCNKHGVIDEQISWPEDGNIVPELLDRAIEADREVELIVKDGYIKELLTIGDYEESDIDNPVVEPKAKAPATKKVVKKDDDGDDDL